MFIAESLGSPHTSVTAFLEIVCMFTAIYRKCVFKYFYEDRMSSAGSGSFVHASVHAICGNAQPTVVLVKGYLSECSVGVKPEERR